MLGIEEGKEKLIKMITPKVTDDLRLLDKYSKQRNIIYDELNETRSKYLSIIRSLETYSYDIEEDSWNNARFWYYREYIGDNRISVSPCDYNSSLPGSIVALDEGFKNKLLNNVFTEEKIRQLLRTVYDKKMSYERSNCKKELEALQDEFSNNKTALLDDRIILEKSEECLKKYQEDDAQAHGFFKRLKTSKLVKKQQLLVESIKGDMKRLENKRSMYENKIAIITAKLEDTGEQEIDKMLPLEKEKFDSIRQLVAKSLVLYDEYATARRRVESFKGCEEYENYCEEKSRLERDEDDLLERLRWNSGSLVSLEEYEEINAAATSTEDTALKRAATKLKKTIYEARSLYISSKDERSVKAKSKPKTKGKER